MHVGVRAEDGKPLPAPLAASSAANRGRYDASPVRTALRVGEQLREHPTDPAEALPVHHVGGEQHSAVLLHDDAGHGPHPFPPGGKQEDG